jgi:hypothetical protein
VPPLHSFGPDADVSDGVVSPSLRGLRRCRRESRLVARSRINPEDHRGCGGGRSPRTTKTWTPRRALTLPRGTIVGRSLSRAGAVRVVRGLSVSYGVIGKRQRGSLQRPIPGQHQLSRNTSSPGRPIRAKALLRLLFEKRRVNSQADIQLLYRLVTPTVCAMSGKSRPNFAGAQTNEYSSLRRSCCDGAVGTSRRRASPGHILSSKSG